MKKFWSRALFILLALGLISGSLMSCSSGDDGNKGKKEQSDPVIPETVTTLSVGAGKTYTTVQSALDKIMADNMTDTVKVEVDPGTYEEFVFYTGSATIILEGQGTAEFGTDVIIKANNSGNSNSMETLAGSHGVTNGYFRGATRFNGSCNLILKNLTIQNTYSRSANDGSNTQAEALVFSSTGKLIANNCSFLGHQDTLYIGSQGNRSWFYKCQIKGDVDFIWGYADVALYEECEIYAIGDDSKLTDTLSASRAMVEAVEANKGIVIMNSNIHIADGVTLTYARNSGADTTAAFFNNVFLSDGTGKIASALYGAKSNYEVYDANGDMVIGWMDGKNYTDAEKTTLVNTSGRLEGTGALVDRYINREYSGRWVILNRGWDFTNKKFRTASKIWDISAFETDFNATADASKGQIFIEPVAAKKVVSGESVTFKAYDVNGADVTSSVTWANTEKSNVTENAGAIVKSFEGAVLVTNATSDTAVVNGTVTVTATSGNFTDTAYVYVIPVYIAADTVTLKNETGSVAQGSSINITGKISFSKDATAEVSDTSTVWTVTDTSVAQIFDKTNNKFLDSYTSTTCDVEVYGVKAGSTTITAVSADGGNATYTLTVTDSTVYYLPSFAGVYVNTDVQSGAYGVWNGVLIDAKTKNNYISGKTAKMGLKQGNTRMQTRGIILNVPVTSDATIKVTLETAPVTVATVTTASSLAYNGLYADGTKVVYTPAVYTDGSSTITEAAYNALGADAQANYSVSEKPYYTIGFDFETQATAASLTSLDGLQTKQTGIDTKEINDLTDAKWCQIGPFGLTDVYITEIAITKEANDKYSYVVSDAYDVAVAFEEDTDVTLDLNGSTTSTRVATVTGSDASAVTVTYSSSNPTIATVTPEGVVTALAIGYTKITASVPKYSDESEFLQASYDVYVKDTSATQDNYSIDLTAVFGPAGDYGKFVVTNGSYHNDHGWIMQNNSTLSVKVNGSSKVSLMGCQYSSGSLPTVKVGDTALGTTATTAKTKDCGDLVTWTYSDSAAATVVFTFTGTTYVHGVTVEKYEVSTKEINLAFAEESANLDLSAEDPTVTRTVTVTGADAADASISYSSSNTGIATVNASTGKVTAVGIGVATITAVDATTEGFATYTVTVKQTTATESMYFDFRGTGIVTDTNAAQSFDFGVLSGSAKYHGSSYGINSANLQLKVLGPSRIYFAQMDYGSDHTVKNGEDTIGTASTKGTKGNGKCTKTTLEEAITEGNVSYVTYTGSDATTLSITGSQYLSRFWVVKYEAAAVTITASDFAATTLSLDLAGTTTNDSQTITASATGDVATTITYSSSKTGVATVDASTGAVTAVAIGRSLITATVSAEGAETVTKTYIVTVKDTATPSGTYTLDFASGNIFDGTTKANSIDLGIASLNAGSKNAYAYNGTQHGIYFKQDNRVTLSVKAGSVITITNCAYDKAYTLLVSTDGTTAVSGVTVSGTNGATVAEGVVSIPAGDGSNDGKTTVITIPNDFAGSSVTLVHTGDKEGYLHEISVAY